MHVKQFGFEQVQEKDIRKGNRVHTRPEAIVKVVHPLHAAISWQWRR
jgi:hypothetical protein